MRMFVYKQIRNTIYIINKIHRKIPKTRSRLKPTTFESETHRSNRKFRNSPIRNKHLHSKSRTKRHFRPLEEFLDIHTFQDTSIIFPHAITVIRTENVEHTHTVGSKTEKKRSGSGRHVYGIPTYVRYPFRKIRKKMRRALSESENSRYVCCY